MHVCVCYEYSENTNDTYKIDNIFILNFKTIKIVECLNYLLINKINNNNFIVCSARTSYKISITSQSLLYASLLHSIIVKTNSE